MVPPAKGWTIYTLPRKRRQSRYDGKLVNRGMFKPSDKTVKLKKPTKEVGIDSTFDDLQMAALLNLIAGKDTSGTSAPASAYFFRQPDCA